jgi:hypothetical protein
MCEVEKLNGTFPYLIDGNKLIECSFENIENLNANLNAPKPHPVFPKISNCFSDPRLIDPSIAVMPLLVSKGVRATHSSTTKTNPLEVICVD